jgi:4-amino-4-deoxy-L-arabinose transferase-like glycosyltransferase
MTDHGLRLGAISYKLAPLYAYWRPHLKGWLVLPIVVLAGYFWILRRTRVATSLTDRSAIAYFVGSFIAITTSVAMLDSGPRSLIAPLLRTDLEYYGAIDRVRNVGEFLRDYPHVADSMPMHAQVHPPGAVLFAWAADRLFGGGPWGAAAGMIAFASLVVPIVYRWAGRVGGPGTARRAAAIYVLTPSAVLFTATSMDGPFAVPLVATMWLFWEAMEGTERPALIIGPAVTGDEANRLRSGLLKPALLGAFAGLAAGLAALMTYSVAVAILFCAIAACVHWFTSPPRRPAIHIAAAAALAGFASLHAVLWLATGYDPIAMFRVAVSNDGDIMSGSHHESLERHVHFFFGNLAVFFISTGLACSAIWWTTLGRLVRGRLLQPTGTPNNRSVARFVLSACGTLLIASAVPVYVLEVERIWMFLVPLVAIPVASALFDEDHGTGRIRATIAATVLVAIQTLVTEVLVTTYW